MEPTQEGWSEIKKEADVNEQGEYVIKKVTLEKDKPSEKKIRGMLPKDYYDLVFKVIGILTIVISAVSLYYTISKDRKLEADKELNDEKEKASKVQQAQRDSIKYYQEEARKDRQFILDNLMLADQQANFQKDFELRQIGLQKQIAAILKAAADQAHATIIASNRNANALLESTKKQSEDAFKKEAELYKLQVYAALSSEAAKLLSYPEYNSDFEISKNKVLIEIMPKVRIIKDSTVTAVAEYFIMTLNLYQIHLESLITFNKLKEIVETSFKSIESNQKYAYPDNKSYYISSPPYVNSLGYTIFITTLDNEKDLKTDYDTLFWYKNINNGRGLLKKLKQIIIAQEYSLIEYERIIFPTQKISYATKVYSDKGISLMQNAMSSYFDVLDEIYLGHKNFEKGIHLGYTPDLFKAPLLGRIQRRIKKSQKRHIDFVKEHRGDRYVIYTHTSFNIFKLDKGIIDRSKYITTSFGDFKEHILRVNDKLNELLINSAVITRQSK